MANQWKLTHNFAPADIFFALDVFFRMSHTGRHLSFCFFHYISRDCNFIPFSPFSARRKHSARLRFFSMITFYAHYCHAPWGTFIYIAFYATTCKDIKIAINLTPWSLSRGTGFHLTLPHFSQSSRKAMLTGSYHP